MFSLLALASSLVWGTSDFLAGVKAKSLPAAAIVGWSQAVALVVMTIAVLLRSPHFADGPWWVWAGVAGMSGSSALICFYAALSTGSMGVVAPIASLGVLVPVTLGVLEGEQPGSVTWLGILVAIILLTGDLPSPANPPKGCRFHTRCPWRQETRCDTERPQLRVVEIDGVPATHRVACHFAEAIASGEIRPHDVAAIAVDPSAQESDDFGSFGGPATVGEVTDI